MNKIKNIYLCLSVGALFLFFVFVYLLFLCVFNRYLGMGQQTCGVAILGPENESIRKDPSWVVK